MESICCDSESNSFLVLGIAKLIHFSRSFGLLSLEWKVDGSSVFNFLL